MQFVQLFCMFISYVSFLVLPDIHLNILISTILNLFHILLLLPDALSHITCKLYYSIKFSLESPSLLLSHNIPDTPLHFIQLIILLHVSSWHHLSCHAKYIRNDHFGCSHCRWIDIIIMPEYDYKIFKVGFKCY